VHKSCTLDYAKIHVVRTTLVFSVCHARKKRIEHRGAKRNREKRQDCCCEAFTIEMLDVVQEYEKLKASDPDFYRAADSMSYGGAGKVPDANIDKMVAELNERYCLLFPLVNAQWLHMGQVSWLILASAAVCIVLSYTAS